MARRRRPVPRRARRSTSSCKAIDWPRHFAPTRTLRVDVAATRSPLHEPRVRDAARQGCGVRPLARRHGVRPSIDKRAPDVRVHAYLTDRDATIYLDTSGEPLFKRGYRRDADEAPLRENLAAGLLALARMDAGTSAARSDVRQRDDRRRGRADRRRPRAGPRAHVRLPEARVVRRPDVAADQAGGARPGARCAGRADDLRERHRRRRRRQDAARTCAPRRSTASSASSSADVLDARRARAARHAASPIRRMACGSPTRTRWQRSIRSSATR